MDKSARSNITRRLILSFCILISIFLLFGLFTFYDIHALSGLVRKLHDHPLTVSNAALQSGMSIAKMHLSISV